MSSDPFKAAVPMLPPQLVPLDKAASAARIGPDATGGPAPRWERGEGAPKNKPKERKYLRWFVGEGGSSSKQTEGKQTCTLVCLGGRGGSGDPN